MKECSQEGRQDASGKNIEPALHEHGSCDF